MKEILASAILFAIVATTVSADPQANCGQKPNKKRSLSELLLQLSGHQLDKRFKAYQVPSDQKTGFTVAIYDDIVCFAGRCLPRRSREGPICTGVLVGKDLVLTAAQCLVWMNKKKKKLSRRTAKNLGVAYGTTNLDLVDERRWEHPTVQVSDYYVHPLYLEYKGMNRAFDVAIIKLKEEFNESPDAWTICLPGPDNNKPSNSKYTMVGWNVDSKEENWVTPYDMKWSVGDCSGDYSAEEVANLKCIDKSKEDSFFAGDFKCQSHDAGAPLFYASFDSDTWETTFTLTGFVVNTDKCDVFINMKASDITNFVNQVFSCVNAGESAKECFGQ